MYNRLSFLYRTNRINENVLDIAVERRWITNEQKQLIVNQ